MDIDNCYCTLRFNARSTGYGREMKLRYAHGNVKIEHRIIGRVDRNGQVFNTNDEKIGLITDSYDIYLWNPHPLYGTRGFMEAGRACGIIEDVHHNELAQYEGDRLGAAAATVCAMYLGFLGAEYEDFYKKA